MELNNSEFARYAGEKILERLGKFARHKKNSKDPERGKNIFGDSSADMKYGI